MKRIAQDRWMLFLANAINGAKKHKWNDLSGKGVHKGCHGTGETAACCSSSGVLLLVLFVWRSWGAPRETDWKNSRPSSGDWKATGRAETWLTDLMPESVVGIGSFSVVRRTGSSALPHKTNTWHTPDQQTHYPHKANYHMSYAIITTRPTQDQTHNQHQTKNTLSTSD